MPKVELSNVTKRFGETTIVDGVSLSVDAGAFLVLVGPSGCGKTTTLRMLAGLEEATSGEIRIGGRRVNELPPKDRDVAMVFQSYALYPHMSVYDNMAFGLSLRRLDKQEIKARVEEAARVLEIGHLLERRPRDLSGGQRQRVAIGRAIVRKPAVFLFDEPLSNLDAALRVQMRAELQALHRRLGATMVYVTHDQVEAMMLATRIAVLEGGKLRQVGPPLELYHRPADRFVAGFIGSPSMNFVEGQVADGVFEAPGLRVPLHSPVEPQKKVTLGVRPHDIALSAAGMTGEATVVEPMGWEAFVHVKCGAGWLVVRLEGEAAAGVKTGDRLTISVPGDKVHLFDEAGRALLHPIADVAASPKVA